MPAPPNQNRPNRAGTRPACPTTPDTTAPDRNLPASPERASPHQAVADLASPFLPHRTFPAIPNITRPRLPHQSSPERTKPELTRTELAVPAMPKPTVPLTASPSVACRTGTHRAAPKPTTPAAPNRAKLVTRLHQSQRLRQQTLHKQHNADAIPQSLSWHGSGFPHAYQRWSLPLQLERTAAPPT